MAKDCILEYLPRDEGEQTVLQFQVGREGESHRGREGGRVGWRREGQLCKARGVSAAELYPPSRNSIVPSV